MSNGPRLSGLIAPPFHAVHADIKAGLHDEYWMKGGRGSTKSSFISLEIVMGLIGTPGAHALIYRRVKDTLRESVYEQIVWALDVLGVREFFTLRVSPMEIRYNPTGQRILFRGADDPGKSKSIKLADGYFGYLWFEEASEFRSMEDIRTIKASVIRGIPPGKRSITFYSYNPPISAQNWVNKEARKKRKGRLVHASDYTGVPAAWLGRDFIAEAEALRASNERAYRHMYLGEVTGSGCNVFANLQLRRITADDVSKLDRFFNGLDFGFAVDPDAYTRWAYDRRNRTLYALEEYYGAHNSTDRLAEEVAKRAGRDPVRCDSADPRMIQELRQRGLQTIGVKKGAGSREHGMRWLQDLGAIIIDPDRTPNIAREFEAYEYAQDRHGNFIADYPDKDDHSIDSCRYALETEIGRKVAKTRSDIY